MLPIDSRQIEDNRGALIADVLRRLEDKLWPFHYALDYFLATLFQAHLPEDWRKRWHTFVTDQAAEGFAVDPKSVTELEVWIEAWAADCDLLPIASPRQDFKLAQAAASDEKAPSPQPGAAATHLLPTVETLPPLPPEQIYRQQTGGPRGDQSRFASEAERLISELTQIPLNEPGPHRQSIPGTGPADIRYPDLLVRGRDGSIRLRGSVVEVKASTGDTFGDLSQRSRQQLLDKVAYVEKFRKKASFIKNPYWKQIVADAYVEVFSDLPAPTKGTFERLINLKLIKWNVIPRSVELPRVITPATKSLTRPGTSAARDVALGIVISVAESHVANEVYRENAKALNGLLAQIRSAGEATEEDWRKIAAEIREIESMKQSALGFVGEFISYGQGSLTEQQAISLFLLADELAEQFGYTRVKTWGDLFTGGYGKFEKMRTE